jgi:hypothetical protein
VSPVTARVRTTSEVAPLVSAVDAATAMLRTSAAVLFVTSDALAVTERLLTVSAVLLVVRLAEPDSAIGAVAVSSGSRRSGIRYHTRLP